MKLDEADFLRLVERAGTLAFVDIEATGLRADYNSTLIVSIKPYDKDPTSYIVGQPGNDQKVIREAKEHLETLDCWCTFYGKGYDIPFLNTRLLRWGQAPINKRPHIDLYYTLKANTLTSRRSQAHMLRFLETPQEKMDMSPESWNKIIADFHKEMKLMKARCESDVEGLEALYKRTKHLIRDIKRG